jgi:hypothetical protein
VRDFWIVYAAIVATLAFLLEVRRWREQKRTRLMLLVRIPLGPDAVGFEKSQDKAFEVVVVNNSSFPIHILRAGFAFGELLRDYLDLPAGGNIGPHGAVQSVLVITKVWWQESMAGIWGQHGGEIARAWVELSTGQTFYSNRFHYDSEIPAVLVAPGIDLSSKLVLMSYRINDWRKRRRDPRFRRPRDGWIE